MATEDTTNTEQQQQEQPQLSEETQRLAELGRNGASAPPEFRPQDAGKPARPADVPEKFWDAEKGAVNQEALLKSYLELEKTRGQPPAQETPEQKAAREEAEKLANETPEQKVAREEAERKKAEEPDNKGDKPDANAETSPLSSAIEVAQADYAANNGELSADSRKALVDAGIPEAQINLYLEGVKAQERAMLATATEAAGGIDVNELLGWAGQSLDEAQISHLNAGLANPKTLADTVRDLAGRYRAANPGEGRLTNVAGSTNYGDVYTSNDEYLKDMAAAEKSGDTVARSKAVQKLSRSRKAGTIKAVTPRRGPFGG